MLRVRGGNSAAIANMGEFKHLVIAKFKEGVDVEGIVKQVKKMVSEIESVKSFEWGHSVEGHDMLTQGFTHIFSMAFHDKEAISSFLSHPKHLEFSPIFSSAIDNILVLDFPSFLLKPLTPVLIPPETAPKPETAPIPAPTSPLPLPPPPASAAAPTPASTPAPA